MAFRFRCNETIKTGFRRITCGEIDKAMRELAGGGDAAVATHRARKAIKRVRALLALCRPKSGYGTLQRENRALAAAGRALAGTRDLDVLLETVTRLETDGALADKAVTTRLKRRIAGIAAEREASGAAAQGRARALAILASSRDHIAALPIAGGGLAAIERGLAAGRRRARRELIRAGADPSADRLHELRKCVQRHWRQMALLSRAWPEALQVEVEAARQLSQLLGEDHDLHALHEAVDGRGGLARNARDARAVRVACARRRQELWRQAETDARRLLAERPRALAGRIVGLWREARREREIETETAGKA